MHFEKLSKVIFSEMKHKLENSQGLSIFSKERAKFEGWVKVELCDILSKYSNDIIPEKNNIDVVYEDWAIEIKTVNTNYRYPNVEDKHRPITMNVKGVIEDIEKLSFVKYPKKVVLFVVFPLSQERMQWKMHLEKISAKLHDLKFETFTFKNNVPGIIYLGLI